MLHQHEKTELSALAAQVASGAQRHSRSADIRTFAAGQLASADRSLFTCIDGLIRLGQSSNEAVRVVHRLGEAAEGRSSPDQPG